MTTPSAVLAYRGGAILNFALTAFSKVQRFLGAPSCFVPWRTYILLAQEYVVFVT
jgi:hypothetical protein